jgi:signal transduction histidine kinase
MLIWRNARTAKPKVLKSRGQEMDGMNLNQNAETKKQVMALLNDALKEIMSIVKAECGSLFLFDSLKNELVLDSFYNANPLGVKDIKRKVGEGISGKVADLRKPVLVKDIDQDSRFNRNGFKHYHTKSFISIPLLGAEGMLGLINIADKANGESFSEKELEFAATLCRYVCIIVDNLLDSDRLREEKESLNKQKSLLEKYASVGKLAAEVVHEVNNPLDGIIRYTNILLTQIENNSVVREYLLEIKKGLHRIGNITRSLLEFSHLVNADAVKIKRYVDVHTLIEESLDACNAKSNDKIRIDKKYNTGLPRVLDFGMSHVIINMIKNALDAMPDGGTLEISTETKELTIQISFKDTGVGMPQEVKDRIFEPFFTTKSIDKGTGLGLAISKEIINKYEGQIEVQSAQGQGSTFTILIPKKYLENA